jgi:hypothetical protein
VPRGSGHQFVIYGDSCSGVPGAPHEETFAQINRIVARLTPSPQFIVFPGDEIVGLTGNADTLRAQWRYWTDVEMKWLRGCDIPVYRTTSNHTVYDGMSEAVFREIQRHAPNNGPRDQRGLSYAIRRGDLLLAFVNTVWSGLGGEGHVETEWIAGLLHDHRDAAAKIVVGHHPVHAVNGYSAPSQHVVDPKQGATLWSIFQDNGVLAYVTSHVLAFDVQVHDGILQLTSAGAGTKHRMPEGIEYLHCVQVALDQDGLRYQVLDVDARVRERLAWPVRLPPLPWRPIAGEASPWQSAVADAAHSDWPSGPIFLWRVQGSTEPGAAGEQTLLSASSAEGLPTFQIGLRGPDQTLTIVVSPEPGRSPGYWHVARGCAGRPLRFPDHGPHRHGSWRSFVSVEWRRLLELAPVVVGLGRRATRLAELCDRRPWGVGPDRSTLPRPRVGSLNHRTVTV